MKVLKTYKLPNDRIYQIVDTEKSYKLGYPEINSGAEHHTMSTGIRIDSCMGTWWGHISSCETLDDALQTLLLFIRQRVPIGSTAESYLQQYEIASISLTDDSN